MPEFVNPHVMRPRSDGLRRAARHVLLTLLVASLGTANLSPTVAAAATATTTTLTCTALVLNAPATCTATVAPSTATGTVSLSTDGSGIFGGNPCTLSGGACSVTFTSTTLTNQKLTATYSGDPTYGASTSHQLTVSTTKRATSTTIVCGDVTLNAATACVATVMDTSTGTASTPAGTVAVVRGIGAGSVTGSPCTLVSGSCSVTYTTTSTVSTTLTAFYNASDTSHLDSSGATTFMPKRASSTTVSCGSATVGVAGSCTATVTDISTGTTTAVTGTVAFSTGGNGAFMGSPCVLSAAACSVSFTPTSTAPQTITASYSGSHASSSGTSTLTAAKGVPTTTFSGAPASAAYLATFTVSSTTDSTSSPVYTASGACGNTGATYTMTSGSGTCTATVSWADDPNYNGATRTQSTTATKLAQTITFAQPPSPQPYGTTFGVGATSGSGGSVTIVASGGCTIVSGTVTMTSATVACDLTASQGGDANYAAAADVVRTVTATVRSSVTALVCAVATLNAATNCIATVTDSSEGIKSAPTGTVTFSTDGQGAFSPARCTLSGGACSVSFTPRSAGGETITAAYAGDASYDPSSTTIVLVSDRGSTVLALACTSATAGSSSICIVLVQGTASGSASTPTGAVAFSTSGEATFSPRSCTLDGGSCSVAFTPSAAGVMTITASYSGDAAHSPTSASRASRVVVRPTGTLITCGVATRDVATTCAVTVTDTVDGTHVPIGSVAFSTSAGGVFDSYSCTLISGSCSVAFTATSLGAHTVTARYGGDPMHGASSATIELAGQGQTGPPACAGRTGPGIPPPTVVPSGLPGFHAHWYGQSGYPTLCPGERSTLTVAYYNSGSLGWVSGRMGEVAYLGTWTPEPGQDRPSALGGDGTNGSPDTAWPRFNRLAIQPAAYVGPGQIAWFQFTIEAPATPGHYRLDVRALIEGTLWMEDFGVFWPVTVLNVDGTAQSVVTTSVPQQ